LKLVTGATESIYIQTPYFIPDESISDALRIAALTGVDVRIMIPCKPDHPFVYWSTLSFVGDLLDSGVKAYTYDNGFIHAKTVVVDGQAASVGSANWDIRSFRLNFEANAFLYSAEYAGQLKKAFLDDLARCTEITPETYAKRSRWIRAKEQFSRLLSPLG
jgi:cardiolipin synthase